MVQPATVSSSARRKKAHLWPSTTLSYASLPIKAETNAVCMEVLLWSLTFEQISGCSQRPDTTWLDCEPRPTTSAGGAAVCRKASRHTAQRDTRVLVQPWAVALTTTRRPVGNRRGGGACSYFSGKWMGSWQVEGFYVTSHFLPQCLQILMNSDGKERNELCRCCELPNCSPQWQRRRQQQLR